MQTALALPAVPTGKIKSFGEPYEVGLPLRQLENGDWTVAITLIKAGEKAESILSHLMSNPDAI